MKKVLIQTVMNIIVIFFIPIVPGVFMGGMQSNGNIYTKDIYSTIFNVVIEKNSIIRADANNYFNYIILNIELIVLIIINILFFIYYKTNNRNKKIENKAGGNNE